MSSGSQLLQDALLTQVSAPHFPAMDARWYAVQTRSRHEKIVATLLQGQDINTFLPLSEQVHRWSDRKKMVQVPMFPGYVFVRVVPLGTQYVQVLRIYGVTNFVGGRRQGVPIPDKQIADIQILLTNNAASYVCPFLRAGQRVRIRGGCLDGIEGLLVARNGNRNLLISVEPIRQSLAISIDGYDVEVV
jgi:transcription antitermination factor NusG